jgi:hypothetical protein
VTEPAAPTAGSTRSPSGDNPQRVRSEAAWAQLCGVAPLEATSGKVTRRHRLNRGGNRQANHALWRIVFTRLGADARTRSYVARRLDEGLSRPEIIRSLKRYVARETDTSHADNLPRRALPNSCLTPRRGVSLDRPADPPLHTQPARLGLIRARPHRVAHHWSASTAGRTLTRHRSVDRPSGVVLKSASRAAAQERLLPR